MMNWSDDEEFWLVWNPAALNPKHQHHAYEQAQAEAERLAEKHVGEKFYICHVVGVSSVQKPSATRKLGPRVPF